MPHRGCRFYVFDASVLIDYCRTEKSLLKLISAHVAPIRTPIQILREVQQLTQNECPDLGVSLTDPSFQTLIEARDLTDSLSLPDRLCFLLARDEKVPCITSDKRLRVFCEANGVKPFWGLEPLLWLVATGALSKPDATTAAKAIHVINPRFITPAIVKAFADKLRAL